MTRQLLQRALDFCDFAWRDVPMNDYAFDKLAGVIAAITTALAQPEQQPIAYMWTEHSGIAGSPLIRYADIPPGYITDAVLLYAAPPAPNAMTQSTHAADVSKTDAEIDTYRNPVDDAALKRAFDAMEKVNDADRLDAQRYRYLTANMTFYNTADSVVPALAAVSDRIWFHATDSMIYPLDAAIDAAITKGNV